MTRVLVTGTGRAGSWQIRGEQLGRAIGATVRPNATDVSGFDLAVVVKSVPDGCLAALQAAAIPVVWDIVDAWPQPTGNLWRRDECLAWLKRAMGRMGPCGVVAATPTMAQDCMVAGRLSRSQVLVLPHHARPGQGVNTIRPIVSCVGYEGGPQYINRWGKIMQAECSARGWEWQPRRAGLAGLDLVVALRDQDGYAARHWKSNVKLANAQATGTPVICSREEGYTANAASGGVVFVDDRKQLAAALDGLASAEARGKAAELLLADAPRLDVLAATYAAWLQEVA